MTSPAGGIPDRRKITSYDIVRVMISAILLTAAALKAYQLATEPVPNRDILSYRWSLMIEVEFELFFGLWLLSGLYRRLAWGLGVVCFAVFSAITLYKGIIGETTCGCFGKIHVNPWYTLMLDLTLLGSLIMFHPRLGRPAPLRRVRLRFFAAAIVALAAGIPAGIAMGTYSPSRLSGDGSIIGSEHFVLLEPEAWLGNPLPLLKYIDIEGKLRAGHWTVVLFHHDCPECRKELPALQEKVRQLASKPGAGKTALVEMPPYGEAGKNLVASNTPCTVGKLSDVRDWFVMTPTVIELSDGVVLSAKEGDSEVQVAGARREPPAAASKVPACESSAKTSHDFGFVDPSSVQAVLFTLENPSDKPLAISKARSECKCMKVTSAPKVIPPGGSAKLRVEFVAPKENMMYSQRVVVLTSNSKNPLTTLTVKASVGMPIEAQPQSFDFGALTQGNERKAEVTLINHGKLAVRPLYCTSTLPGIIALVPRIVIPPGGKVTIPIVARAESLPAGKGAATLHIQTDSPSQGQVELTARYSLTNKTEVTP
jgi:hypothetical protein